MTVLPVSQNYKYFLKKEIIYNKEFFIKLQILHVLHVINNLQ